MQHFNIDLDNIHFDGLLLTFTLNDGGCYSNYLSIDEILMLLIINKKDKSKLLNEKFSESFKSCLRENDDDLYQMYQAYEDFYRECMPLEDFSFPKHFINQPLMSISPNYESAIKGSDESGVLARSVQFNIALMIINLNLCLGALNGFSLVDCVPEILSKDCNFF